MEENKRKVNRRDVLKSLATLPVLGAAAYGVYKKRQYEQYRNSSIADELGMSSTQSTVQQKYERKVSNDKEIRIGIIGYGIRGKMLAAGLGFAHPDEVEDMIIGAQYNKDDHRYELLKSQEDLNVRITAVCDIFDTYGNMAREMGANIYREGKGGRMGDVPFRFRSYKELISSPDVDAVVIATPDHWHGPMSIEAAKAGKHIYCEKPMTWTVDETYEVRRIVKENNIVFQLGHQGRQIESYAKAKEAIEKGLLGTINLVETTTNRNDPGGAWVYDIHKDATPETIDWKQFIGPAPWHDFSLERFFRWRCWWDYSTGLSGDLLTHQFDALNQILKLGIPESAISTGGIYFYKDGRTVPDVLTTVFEYPKRDLSLIYSATLSSEVSRGTKIMGHDAYMEIGRNLSIYADRSSTKYKEKIKNKLIDPSVPVYSYIPGAKTVDAVTSATALYFAERGLLSTYRDGKEVDTTHLHLKEWIECIRGGGVPSCNVDQGFVEAIAAHMGTLAYKNNKRVFWDAENEKIII
jgi:predicted dehydrogenase